MSKHHDIPYSSENQTELGNYATEESIILPNGYELVTVWKEEQTNEESGEVKEVERRLPVEMLAQCDNPFDDHDYRIGFKGQDMFQTDSGAWLCPHCREKNDGHKKTAETWGWLPKWICDPKFI